MHTHLAGKRHQCGKGGGFHDTCAHRNHHIWYVSSHMCTQTHTHTHTHARTYFDIGTGTVGLPSLQRLVRGGRLCFCDTLFKGGLENYLGLGGVELRGLGGCSFLCFTGGVLFDFYDTGLRNCKFKMQVCHAMLCSVVVCCGLVRCKSLSCSVLWCGVVRFVVVCDLMWCAVLCGGG